MRNCFLLGAIPVLVSLYMMPAPLEAQKPGFNYTITTLAGPGDPGDGGPATSAWLVGMGGLAVDGSGNIYIADSSQHRIRKITPAGMISTVAGTGIAGYSGDGGPATEARLAGPSDVAVDAAGNLYVADFQNYRIRKVTSTGIISTVAGSGVWGFSGDGGPAVSAQLSGPAGVAVDAKGNLYIADSYNCRIRKVTPAGIISTYAGSGSTTGGPNSGPGFSGDGGPAAAARLGEPLSIVVDTAGNVYFYDNGNTRVRKITPDGTINTFAGTGKPGSSGDNGPATQAQLMGGGLAVDGTGNLYIAGYARIRRVTPAGVITTVAGNGADGFGGDGGPGAEATFEGANDVALDGLGNLLIVDGARIRRISGDGIINTIAGTRDVLDGGPAIAGRIRSPRGAAADAMENLYFVDQDNVRVRLITVDGLIKTVAGNGTRGFRGDGGPADQAQLSSPFGITVDESGNLFLSDSGRVRKITTDGIITTIAGNGTDGFSGDGGAAVEAQLNYPQGLAVDSMGNLYIADAGNSRIRRVTPAGVIDTVAGTGTAGFSGDGGPAVAAQVACPYDLAVDALGNLYVSDGCYRSRIRRVTPAGIISTMAGNGEEGGSSYTLRSTVPFGHSGGLGLDATGNLYVADWENCRIAKITPEGAVNTIAGRDYGFDGDGGPAFLARLNGPHDVAVDPSGNVYITDTYNNRIRKLTPRTDSCPVTLSTAPSQYGAGGGSGSIAVTAEAGCPWLAVASVPWLIINRGESGLANGTIQYSIVANQSDAPRTGTLTINDQTLSVAQDAGGGAICVTTDSVVWFESMYYISNSNAAGDRLLVGKMSMETFSRFRSLALSPRFPNDRFCGQIMLAPGVTAEAYVPKAEERMGNFSAFSGLLLDPATARPGPDGATIMDPFPGGIIPMSRQPDPFAWRIISATKVSPN